VNNKEMNQVFGGEAKFIIGATNYKDVPKTDFPEFAFLGRSNVGKSTLINTLLNRKKLVRTSKNPGCTRQINIFEIANTFNLVDLPGYGFARVSKSDKKNWERLIVDYLSLSKNLQYCFVLVDARRLFKDVDLQIMDILEGIGAPYQIVFTKTDKKNELKDFDFAEFTRGYPSCFPEYIAASAENKNGINDVRERIMEFLK